LNELGGWKAKLRPGLIPSPIGFDESLKMVLIKRTWTAKRLAIKVAFRSIMQKLTGKHLVSAGYALQGRMLQAAVKAGVEIRTNAPVRELLLKSGRVVGVRVMQDGVERRIGARAGVLINAGGFSHNKEMRELYQPKPASIDWTHANPGDTGEMIQEAMRIGAAVDLMEESWWIPTALPPKPHRSPRVMVLTDTAKPHCIIVDATGQRYMNESASYMEVGQNMYRRHKQAQAVPSWLILDSQHRRNYFLAHQMPGVTPKEWLDSGFLKTADTIEGLAVQCGIDAARLKATVTRFNRYARRGVDEDFARGARQYDQWFADPTHQPVPTLGELETPPFYALQVFPGDVGTAGGVVADEYGRALRPDGGVIEGLYATGNSTAGVTGRFYVGAGSSIGASMTFGYIAARHATGAESTPARRATGSARGKRNSALDA
ncbi:MAG TPA: FAD-binding protein, partial [Caulobacteraceae bacterium]|nr:FAD-binding protein [Caulobacteraceae bacterium]